MIRLLFFGRFTDIMQSTEVELPDDITSTDALTVWLGQNHEGFQDVFDRSGTRIAVNQTLINQSTAISDNDEIAYMSALSGG